MNETDGGRTYTKGLRKLMKPMWWNKASIYIVPLDKDYVFVADDTYEDVKPHFAAKPLKVTGKHSTWETRYGAVRLFAARPAVWKANQRGKGAVRASGALVYHRWSHTPLIFVDFRREYANKGKNTVFTLAYDPNPILTFTNGGY